MTTAPEHAGALRVISALENGDLPPFDAALLAEDLDHVLVYVIVSYLRAIHPASDPAASSVLKRVVEFTSASTAIVKKHREGEQDPVSRWFEEEYEYRDFRGRAAELIDLIADKLDS